MNFDVASLKTMDDALTPRYARGMERWALEWGTTAGGVTDVQSYDFAGYAARHGGRLPDRPAYLLIPHLQQAWGVVIEVRYVSQTGGTEQSLSLDVPAGWPAGRPLAVPLPGAAAAITPALRVTGVRLPTAAAGWTLVALLGNLAKLLWVVAAEREELRAQALDITAQTDAKTARDAGLDLLGQDLGVLRFPPRPHSWDPVTIALWHLDDQPPAGQPEVTTVAEESAGYAAVGHPGQNGPPMAASGRSGRFGGAFGFSGGRQITIAHHSAFDLPAGASFTAEALLAPTVGGPGGVALGKGTAVNVGAGWSLAVGRFLGVDGNCRFTVSDGVRTGAVHGDKDLRDGRFHHVAATLHGSLTPPMLRLLLDGVEVDRRPVPQLGAIATTEPVVLGDGRRVDGAVTTPLPYDGLLDEVRLSSVARTDFTPVLGEGDTDYRRRLEVFQRWRLPTPEGIAHALNELVGPVAGEKEPFVVEERLPWTPAGSASIRVLPPPLPPGRSITAAGEGGVDEVQVAGADDVGSDPAWLTRCPDAPGLVFAAETDRWMHWAAREGLEALRAELAGAGGTLTAARHGAASGAGTGSREDGPEVGADPVAAAGRRLLLRHDGMDAGKLAVAAHAAGFAWVWHRPDGTVVASVPQGNVLRVLLPGLAPVVPGTPEVAEGGTLALRVDPSPAAIAGGEVRWSVLRAGAGAARLEVTGLSPDAVLHADAAGDVVVQIEIARRHLTARGARRIRIGLNDTSLGAGQTIAADGRRGVRRSIVGLPVTALPETSLVTRTDDLTGAAVGYTSLDARRVHPEAGRRLDRLLKILSADGGKLQVKRAFVAGADPLVAQGRVLELTHTAFDGPALAARAFAAGFAHLDLSGPLRVTTGDGEPLTVLAPARIVTGELGAPGDPAPVKVEPRADARAVSISPDGRRAYVTDRADSRIAVYALAPVTPGGPPRPVFERSVAVLPAPDGLVITTDRVFALHPLLNRISVLTTDGLTPVADTGTTPQPVALAHAGTRVFVASAGSGTPSIRAYDATTGAPVAGPLVLPAVPRALAATPDGNGVYVVLADDRFLRVDTATLTLAGPPVATGVGAVDAVVTAGKLYIACEADDAAAATGTIRVHRVSDHKQVAVVSGFAPGMPPHRLAAADDGTRVFAATAGVPGGPDEGRGEVRVLDVAASSLLDPALRAGGAAGGLAATPSAGPYRPGLAVLSPGTGTLLTADLGPLAATPPHDPEQAGVATLGRGNGEEAAWSVVPLGAAAAEPETVAAPSSSVRGVRPGTILVRALYLPADGARPYQFAVRLSPALEARPDVRLRKDQYDLVMNALTRFCPIGVEVRTDLLRARVVELVTLDDLLPGYTFPVFRRRGPARTRQEGDR
ncbi:LamG-like jellyroll fold domain-containing protein [Pseudarthrobacter sulfonivorans]|uniref:LamG-like jellyroll fold domain-containing protein n=1 Tax=Pseudarthrobacter sulfonivorans TaxID=121292 RepID=UPI00278A0293|nr:LamG-like jellyroll fold domain-containing protein [Pseudarthrobacter sulfonivorans]MDQ0000095.1 DNA-binding beta-propeller fold protein YncE [Pseudarthrobacter sulfonivorans]